MPAPSLADATSIVTNNGLRTQYGLILPPGARVAAYVRSTGVQSGDDAFLAQNLVTTLAAGCARVRPNMGDFVVVLPGHAETVDVAQSAAFNAALVAGTKIVGVGRGSNMPAFTWNIATAGWVLAVNDVMIAGLHLLTAGSGAFITSNTTLAISITGNDVALYNNDIECGTGFANTVSLIAVSGTASRFDISGNIIRGQVSATLSTQITLSGTGSDGRIADNEIIAGAIVATGNINITGAVPRLKILRNVINNFTVASVAAIAYANVAITGQCAYNTMTVLSTGAVSAGVTGITVGGTNNLTGYFQNFCVNDPNKSGLLVPAVDT